MPGRSRQGPGAAVIVYSEELRRHLRSRWFLISTVVVVILLLIATALIPVLVRDEGKGGEAGRDMSRIGFVDESGWLGRGVAGGGAADEGVSAVTDFSTGAQAATTATPGAEGAGAPREFADRDAGLQALLARHIDWLYVVPADYLQSGLVEQYGEFAGRFPSNPRGEAVFSSLLIRALLSGQVEPDLLARVLQPAQYQSYRVEAGGVVSDLPAPGKQVAALLIPVLFAGLLGMGLAASAGIMVQAVGEEKETRLVEVIITSASPFSLLAGKLLALVTIGLAQAAVWILATALAVPPMFHRLPGIGEFTVPAGLWVTIAGCFVGGYLLVASLTLLVGAIAPSAREASGLGAWVGMVPFVPVWFVGLVMTQPDGVFGRVLSYFPLTAPTGILVRLAAGGEMTAWQIGAALVGTAVVALVVLWLATRVFRAAVLMRGQSFTLRNLWSALRGAQ